LVEWQVRVAQGEPLPPLVESFGHAVEARLYAEDPYTYLPATGRVLAWRADPGVRVESGIETGDYVTPHYDPMLAKLIAHGPDRATALRRLDRALERTVLLGLTSNLPLLKHLVALLSRGEEADTAFLERHPLPPAAPADAATLAAAALADWLQDGPDDFWRIHPTGAPPQVLEDESGKRHTVQLFPPIRGDRKLYRVLLGECEHAVEVLEHSPPELRLAVDGLYQAVLVLRSGQDWWLFSRSGPTRVKALPRLPEPAPGVAAGGGLRSPMPGAVTAVLVEVGQSVRAGTPLMKLEAMKMEHTITANGDGVVEAVHFTAGDQVEADAELVRLRLEAVGG
ncbi:MAG: biotin/lipoyl-containing protein, partial [Candidatus Eremiobacterota bacterium]